MTKTDIHAEDEFSKFRNLDGWLKRFVNWILLAIPIVGCSFIMDGPFYLNWTILMEQYYGIMIAMIFPCVFFLMPMTNRAPKNRVPWCDVVLAILSIIVRSLCRHILSPNFTKFGQCCLG